MFLAIQWDNIVTEIILSIVGLALTALSTYATVWVNDKVKSEKGKRILNGALTIVSDGVSYTYQTFVEGLKGTSLWDEAAMQTAKDKAFDYVKGNLSDQALEYIKTNFGDITEWINNQIEIAIQKSKNN